VVKLDTTHTLLSAIRPDAIPVAVLKPDTPIEILARFDNYNFVKTESGKAGWLYN
jgi:SH3-like domain-containing protein